MATVNIPSYLDDPNYRYKMPRVKAKTEGRGNGVKTNIMNMGDIARALKRAPEYATKFCGCELGASSKFESAEGKAIVNGIHPEADVQVVIDKFIERFVLCPKCRLPEVDLGVVKGRVQGVCNACGFNGDMDNSHKVATFIIKNPPAVSDSTMGKKAGSSISNKKEELEKKRSKDKDAAPGGSSSKEKEHNHSSSHHRSGEGSSKDKEKSKKDKSKRKHHHNHTHERTQLGYDSEEITGVIKRLVNFLNKGEKPTTKEFFQEIRLLQVAQDFNGALRVYCALKALHDAYTEDSHKGGSSGSSPATSAKDLPLTPDLLNKYAGYLAATCDRSIEGSMILEALEQYIERNQVASVWSSYAVMLSSCYQKDILEEDCVLKRYGQPLPPPVLAATVESMPPKENLEATGEQASLAAGQAPESLKQAADAELSRRALEHAHRSAEAFVRWLKEADSASSSGDDEEGQRQNSTKRTDGGALLDEDDNIDSDTEANGGGDENDASEHSVSG